MRPPAWCLPVSPASPSLTFTPPPPPASPSCNFPKMSILPLSATRFLANGSLPRSYPCSNRQNLLPAEISPARGIANTTDHGQYQSLSYETSTFPLNQRPQGHPAKSKFLAMKIPINQIFILCVAASIPIHTCLADSPSAGATSTGGLNRDVRSALARTVEFFKKRAAEDEEGWILSQTSPSPTTASTQTETAGSVSTANTYTPSCVSAYRTQTKKA